MTTISKSALVSYSPEQMFKLVDDIEAYSDFLPWCGKATEISRNEKNVEASLLISHSGLNKEFTTVNKNTQFEKIEMHLVNGPFKNLDGVWMFETLGDAACKISLHLEFEFSSKIIGITLGPVFSKIANTLVDAFIKRADTVYG
ncbi:MAG: type II toxin-antitoxin system RatA family toxin [Gammaproteobacteria bacterium]|nr:type II toxin-antitoxin system RatA family toxin [Gammaproteobacteria bacterium]MCW8988581.1 type II toxin-antitoxin system RatA family toxin [Gammaproteobacteria bacterium]MCW9031879.1 type II toxin-antitoxin system RatA family toxin [Gammaproteobacteria bacterium]